MLSCEVGASLIWKVVFVPSGVKLFPPLFGVEIGEAPPHFDTLLIYQPIGDKTT